MNKRIEELILGHSTMRIQEVWSEKCGAEHFTKDCPTGNPSYQPEGGMHQEEKSSMEQMMQKFISSTETRMQNPDASIKNLENHIGQLAKAMSSRDLGTLPSDTAKNPKEQVKSVELRSGKRIESERQEAKEPEDTVLEKTAGKSSTSTQPPTSQNNVVIPPPFPTALKKAKLESQFAKFLEVFKKLNINIHFSDTLMKMPSYAKFLKEIFSNKRKLEENAMISLTKNCSALVQNKIPPKQKEPGSFSIPCMINDVKLSLGEPKPTRMSLQLADRSLKYPRGIIEDVLVKVDKLIFPVDFVVLDMEEDLDMPLILGRPLLAIGKALIDVKKRELLLTDTFQEPLEAALVSSFHEDEINVGREEMTAYLNDNQSCRKGGKLKLEDLGDRKDLVLQKPILEEPPTVALKPLPTHLKYVFLGENENLPGGITVIKNEQNELITFRTVTGWRVCIDYRKLNDATCNDHFPLPFIDQMLERLYGYEFYCFLDGYSGDFSIFGQYFDAFLNNLNAILMRCEETNFVLNWEKCHFMVREGIVMGHRISEHGIEVDRAKAFKTLREKLVTSLVLTSPNWDLPFEVMCDASDSAIGAVHGQRIDNVLHTIYYASKTLNEAQLNYATTEKELLAVVFALDKFHSYLVLSKITVFTYQSAIRHLLAKKDAKPWLIRSIPLLQEFDLEIKDKKGNDTEEIDDWFPDEQLFAIENAPWSANFVNYLVMGTPHNLSFHQKKKFMSDVKNYFWEEPFLFKVCADSMIRRCVAEDEMRSILSHCHDREVGGHNGPIKTTAKVLECGFYWPNLFKDARAYVLACDRCQRIGEKRLLELHHLEEFRDHTYDMAVSYKEQTKRIHDRRIRHREFKEGDDVLLFNSQLRLFPGKLKSSWSGPFKITRVYPSKAIEIKDARNESFTVNAQRIKHYVGGDVDSMPIITTLADQD
ncbi:uncharacterized protein [Henckelia pumila]|uniref:uncharacterized protein n=1 Tax=Henckelia pumila TaxID=405737 RepID=UPI003C6E68B2